MREAGPLTVTNTDRPSQTSSQLSQSEAGSASVSVFINACLSTSLYAIRSTLTTTELRISALCLGFPQYITYVKEEEETLSAQN